MASAAGSDGSAGLRRSRLERIGDLVLRRPKRVVALWLLVVGALAICGLGIEGELSTRAIFVDGTATKREHRIVTREFGSENAVVVMLRGPRAAVDRQGRALERKFEALPRATALSPWVSGGSIEGLRPSPRTAALVVSFQGESDEDLLDVLTPVRRVVDETVEAPVSSSIAGAPAIVDSIQSAAERAASLGERIAIPVLLVVLLLVFRSVLAAAMPVLVGGAVVAATRGVLSLASGLVHLDTLALGASGMMGLALGVDYSLLIVSRFREEMEQGADLAEAVRRTVAVTGRTVVVAGSGLAFAMLVAAQLLPGAVVTSVAISIVAASAFSVLSAIFVVPAILVLLGPRLERWSLPKRRRGGWASSFSAQLSARPRTVVLPIVLVLAFAALWAFSLDTGVATVALLPPGDSGRLQQEEVQDALGPGWVAPLEIVMEGRDGPVTTPRRLKALADFQRRVERDPGVATMTGFAGIERATHRLGSFERTLVSQERGLGKLDHGISRVHEGAILNTKGLLQAANGAGQLDTALGATHGGAGLIAKGLRSASGGSARLAAGLDSADGGSGKLADGTAKASAGAGRLTGGLSRAEESTGEIASSAQVLEGTMRTGERHLDEAEGPLQTVEARLAAARTALQEMTTGRSDPRYTATLEAIDDATAWLTGTDPRTGEPSSATEGTRAGIKRVRGQFDLGLYLSRRLGKNGEEASAGMAKLVHGAERLDYGLDRLATGSRKLSVGIGRLSEGGGKLAPGLDQLSKGAEKLEGGLGEIAKGSGALAGGLGGGAQKSKLLSGALQKIHGGIERRQGDPGSSPLDDLRQQSPGLFRSGYFYLASLDGAKPRRRGQAGFLVSVDRGGSAARMLVIPRYDPSDPRARETRDRLAADAADLARDTGTQVVVGGVTSNQLDIDGALRAQTPLARLALALMTIIILIPVVRSLIVPLLAALLNLVTVAATFGVLALLFDDSLLGGPGYVETTVLPATIMVVFGLAIDYEVFVFSRIREEYLRSGSTDAAVANGLARIAPVVTGAAMIMIVVFLSFAASSFTTMREFGIAQAVGVFIDAFVVRLIVVPAMMRALGDRAWWMPRWLDRLLPGTPNASNWTLGEA